MMNILRASHVTFKAGIQYPEIDIEAGLATFIQGVSGCGKSTLLKLFNGTVSPDQGQLFYRDMPLNTLDTVRLRQEVLLVGQVTFLFPGTIEDNFLEYYKYRELDPIPTERMEHYLSLCSLEFPLDSICDTMSGGERQRVYLAICLSLGPQVLMLDEPTSALDEKTAQHLIHHIKRFCKEEGITVVVVSHDAALTKQFADHIIILEKGDLPCKA